VKCLIPYTNAFFEFGTKAKVNVTLKVIRSSFGPYLYVMKFGKHNNDLNCANFTWVLLFSLLLYKLSSMFVITIMIYLLDIKFLTLK